MELPTRSSEEKRSKLLQKLDIGKAAFPLSLAADLGYDEETNAVSVPKPFCLMLVLAYPGNDNSKARLLQRPSVSVSSVKHHLKGDEMSKTNKCPKCGEKRKLRIMLLDTPENREKEEKDPEGILLVGSKALNGKMECLKCRHLWTP